MHGRTADPDRTLETRAASAIWARVISTASQAPSASASSACPGSTIEPWATTATCAGTAARTSLASSMLKPGGACVSGRVADAVKIEPRTTVM